MPLIFLIFTFSDLVFKARQSVTVFLKFTSDHFYIIMTVEQRHRALQQCFQEKTLTGFSKI